MPAAPVFSLEDIMIFLLIFFGLLFAFALYTRKFNNPYKLYLLFGKKGSGKTTFLIRKALYYLNRGWNVYTNIEELFIPGVRHIDAAGLGDFCPVANSVLLVDEINLLWDNRDYKSFPKQTQRFFRLQRHYKVLVYLASQTYDCDKKIRDQVDAMYLCTCVSNVISIARRIIKKPVITASSPDTESRISEDLKMLPFWKWTFTWIPRYAKYFDSHAADPLPDFRFSTDEIDVSARKQYRALRKAFKIQDKRAAQLPDPDSEPVS